MNVIDQLGGPAAVARMVGCKPPSVIEWRKRGIPAERCPQIERATTGAVTCEALRPDVAWTRVPDPDWPHASGRPLIDVARPLVAVQEAA
jgi:DNA-binding transcriptional regulator YdaS (Cro superfamily)